MFSKSRFGDRFGFLAAPLEVIAFTLKSSSKTWGQTLIVEHQFVTKASTEPGKCFSTLGIQENGRMALDTNLGESSGWLYGDTIRSKYAQHVDYPLRRR